MKHLKKFESVFENLPEEVHPDDIKARTEYKATVIDPDFEDDDIIFDIFILEKHSTTMQVLLITDLPQDRLEKFKNFLAKYTLTDFMTVYSGVLTEEDVVEWDIKGDKIHTIWGHEVVVFSKT